MLQYPSHLQQLKICLCVSLFHQGFKTLVWWKRAKDFHHLIVVVRITIQFPILLMFAALVFAFPIQKVFSPPKKIANSDEATCLFFCHNFDLLILSFFHRDSLKNKEQWNHLKCNETFFSQIIVICCEDVGRYFKWFRFIDSLPYLPQGTFINDVIPILDFPSSVEFCLRSVRGCRKYLGYVWIVTK